MISINKSDDLRKMFSYDGLCAKAIKLELKYKLNTFRPNKSLFLVSSRNTPLSLH